MRNILVLICILLASATMHAQNFKFAVISDLHISPTNPQPMEDLKKVVSGINDTKEIQFVLVLGDITEQGDKASLLDAKIQLDQLNVKYHAVSGMNETKWSPSGATAFKEVFGDERFDFEHGGIRFLGFASGPMLRMMDGHIDIDDIFWLSRELSKNPNQPVIISTHYPLTMQDVDNWYEATDVLRLYNIKAILSGRYHKNSKASYDGIPAFINTTTQRTNYDGLSSFNIYTVTSESITAAAKKVDPTLRPIPWADYSMLTKYYTKDTGKQKRPSFAINNKYPKVNYVWSRTIFQSIYTSPASNGSKIFFGDDNGGFYAFDAGKDNMLWKYETGGRILGTADANQRIVVFGSTDKTIYGLDVNNGNVLWQQTTGEPILGSATIDGGVVYIGGGNGNFYALDINSGTIKWQYAGIGNYIECKPLVHQGKVIFGAWDGHLYALNKNDGTLAWQWKNPTEGMHSSPAAVWPVAANDRVYFTSPDRYITALNVNTGDSIWRTNQSMVRESIGVSEDKQRIYVKTMQDSVICYSTKANSPERLWATNIGFGTDPSPTMLVEKDGTVFGSTKNGVIFAINGKKGELQWMHKLGNTLIGTVVPVNGNRCLYVTSQGYIGMLEGRK